MATPPSRPPDPPAVATLPTQQSRPSLYAEFLPKLGRMSVVIHLPTPSTHCTKVLVSADASRLLVYHERVTTELVLPVKSRLAGEHLPQVIPPGLDKMSWRLVPRQDELTGSAVENIVPWSAANLHPNVDVVCRECAALIVSKGDLRQWKDLPSENWAEMMEFWHCHKPTTHAHGETDGASGQDGQDEKKASESALASRGYGANSAIVAQEGVGFVDLMRMWFYEDHCRALTVRPNGAENGASPLMQVSQNSVNVPTAVFCPGCSTHLGHSEHRKNAFSLFKWKIKLADPSLDSQPPASLPSLSHCLAAALLEMQARTGSAKIVLQGDKESITVWVLNPYIKFSCQEKQKVPAMKVLFQDKAMEEDEMDLPDDIIMDIRGVLQESNNYLPLDEKTKVFDPDKGVWTVALLDRLER